jgi:hypothetical protein
MTAVRALPSGARTREADLLLEPLLRWLRSNRRVRPDSRMFLELPWSGRRVDVVTVGVRLRTAAFELKLSDSGRALEQAIYNRAAFDRSYVVLPQRRTMRYVDEAARFGVGVLVVADAGVRLILESPFQRPSDGVRKRLLASLRATPQWHTHL